MGAWAIDKGILLEWTDGDVWEAKVDIEPGTHEFKVRTWAPSIHLL